MKIKIHDLQKSIYLAILLLTVAVSAKAEVISLPNECKNPDGVTKSTAQACINRLSGNIIILSTNEQQLFNATQYYSAKIKWIMNMRYPATDFSKSDCSTAFADSELAILAKYQCQLEASLNAQTEAHSVMLSLLAQHRMRLSGLKSSTAKPVDNTFNTISNELLSVNQQIQELENKTKNVLNKLGINYDNKGLSTISISGDLK
jgi:hypothetical protein